MLHRVTMRTRFVTLLVLALVALGAVGVPSLRDHGKQRDAAQRSRDRVRIAGTLGDFLDQLAREATLTSWFATSGEPTVRTELAATRPLTDRIARSIGSQSAARSLSPPVELTLREVFAQWNALRTGRARFDRRLASDDQVLVQFDRSANRVVEALDAVAAEPSGLIATDVAHDPTRALHARAQLAEIERNAAASQAAVMTAVVRHEVSPTLARRLRTIADRQAAEATLPRADGNVTPGSAEAWRALRPLARTTAAYRAPALVGRLPFVTATEWRRVSGLELDAIRQIGTAAERVGAESAAGAAERARSASLRATFVLVLAALALTLAAWLISRTGRRQNALSAPVRPATAIETATTNIGGPRATTAAGAEAFIAPSVSPPSPSPSPAFVATPEVVVIPALPRRVREDCSPEPEAPLPVPSQRSPGAAFELIARYEAGLRRARTAPDPGHDSQDSP